MIVKNVTTKSGIQPSNRKLEFTVTTADIAKYLGEKFADINASLKKQNANIPVVDPNQIEIKAVRIGKNFVPILLILPQEALRDNPNDADIPSIFKDENESVILKKWYWEFLLRFMYDKNEAQAINSRTIQRTLGITSVQHARLFRVVSTPKVEVKNKGTDKETRTVVLFLSLERVVHDMLLIDGAPQNFDVNIQEVVTMKDGSATYEIERAVKKKKKDKADATELLRNILNNNQ